MCNVSCLWAAWRTLAHGHAMFHDELVVIIHGMFGYRYLLRYKSQENIKA